MTLEILTPDKKVFEGEVTSVTVPGTLGSFQILRGHAPIISTLEDGLVIIKSTAGENTFSINGCVV
jgi:F-type H+-transporting ATPase subunit epsilon